MKKQIPKRLEQYRVKSGPMKSSIADGRNGAFLIPGAMLDGKLEEVATVVVSEGNDQIPWDHVSMSWKDHCPSWHQMCRLKDLFFNPHEVVVQFHPAEADYVNYHYYCLHLWKPTVAKQPTPPTIAIGPVSKPVSVGGM